MSDELDRLQSDIARLKSEQPPEPERQVSVGLVFSLGFSFVAALLAGDYLGGVLATKAGNPNLRLVGWGLGLALAGFTGYKQMRPYLG